MRCQSVVGLWPASLPPHRPAAAAALDSPPAIYTGGSDGSIVWWTLSPDGGEIRPTALLCGHSAAISILSPSSPPSYDPSAPLLSASADGVLCHWSRASGRCLRRRRLPPSASSPSTLAAIPSSPRHVCIAGGSPDSVTVAAVVVDSHSLDVVQTVFHGIIAIARPVRSVVVDGGGKGRSLILVDGTGKLQSLAISKSSDHGGDSSGGGGVERTSSCEVAAPSPDEGSPNGVQSVAIGARGELLALVFEDHCEFRSVANGVLFGVIPLVNLLGVGGKDSSFQQFLVGGMFLEDYNADDASEFLAWSSSGAAFVCKVFCSGSSFRFEVTSQIPAVDAKKKGSFDFCQLNRNILRIESACHSVGDSKIWKPHISMWSLSQFAAESLPEGKNRLCLKLGKGRYSSASFSRAPSHIQSEGSELSLERSEERSVSSSLILSEDFCAPYAMVCGFYDGRIEVVRLLGFFPEFDSKSDGFQGFAHPRVSGLFFEGHTDAVLCLAAHTINASSAKEGLRRAMVSGSMDCTVRIWDMDTGSPVWVMHHHVAPVRQIILPPDRADVPWSDCFLSVGEDGCVALVSFETLRVERMFPGHLSCPSMVVWDSIGGYIACFCESPSGSSDARSVLYLWDVKTGARERVIRGQASRSMFDHFCKGVSERSYSGKLSGGSTSNSALLPIVERGANSSLSRKTSVNGSGNSAKKSTNATEASGSRPHRTDGKVPFQSPMHESENNSANYKGDPGVSCSCPFVGTAALTFNLSGLMSLRALQKEEEVHSRHSGAKTKEPKSQLETSHDTRNMQGFHNHGGMDSFEARLLRFCLCLLHLWDVDCELDKLLVDEMDVRKPEGLSVAPGMLGDRDSMTLMFPDMNASLQLWKSSPEFCAMRSLTIVSIAQHLISLSNSSKASSVLAAFYTRNFAEKVPDINPPLLQLLVSFWQDTSEHVRMSARSLFHCAAPRAIPSAFCGQRAFSIDAYLASIRVTEGSDSESYLEPTQPAEITDDDELQISSIVAWLESFEDYDWVSCIGGTSQDAMSSHIVVASALAVWYPSKVKDKVPKLVVSRLIKLVMSMNDHYSSTAAELLAEGMSSTWKACIGSEAPHLFEDIFFQIECLSGTSSGAQNPAVALNIREALVEILLPSLAMAEIPGFLNAIEGQIWATSSDSPIHMVSLKTLIRVARGSPKLLAPYLDKVMNYVLHTIDHGNSVMRRACYSFSMITLRELARTFSMVSLNETATRLAVGDAIGDIQNTKIRVYDLESVTLIKVLDASGPPGHPSLLDGASDTRITTGISVLGFSSDGEGLVAFSENGLIIRWWSLGNAWWEKLSRSLIPVQCTKLIFVPPWEGFSPNSSRSSIIANILGDKRANNTQDKDDAEYSNLVLHNLDLSYRLRWIDGRKVVLTRYGTELGTFQL